MDNKIKVMQQEINKIIIGKEKVVKYCLVSLLAGGHILLEDVPGVGKTTLAKAIAGVCDCDYGRIQFTPDTLPSDVTGVSVYHMNKGEFEFMPGAVMHSIVLGDEINRTSPKTQASLLEAMEEGQVSVDGKTYELPKPFMVIATQNPASYLGTYKLPEAQMDRFLMKLSLGYPDKLMECNLIEQFLNNDSWKLANPVISAKELCEIKEQVKAVKVSDEMMTYIVDILDRTRNNPMIELGASPRAGLALVRASQALAYMNDRDFITPDDVIELLVPVLGHRLALSQEADMKKQSIDKIVNGIRAEVRIPV